MVSYVAVIQYIILACPIRYYPLTSHLYPINHNLKFRIFAGMIKDFIAIGAGGAVGAMLRYGMTVLGVHLHWSSNLPTFLVNVVGSFVMGILISSCGQGTLMMMLTVGLCGGFTTFSTFSMQSLTLMQDGKWGQAALFILGTLIVCIMMAWIGCLVGQKLKL